MAAKGKAKVSNDRKRHRVLTRPKVRKVLTQVALKRMTPAEASYELGWPKRLFNKRYTRFMATFKPEVVAAGASAPKGRRESQPTQPLPDLNDLIEAGTSFLSEVLAAHAQHREVADLQEFVEKRQRQIEEAKANLIERAAKVIEKVGT